MFHYTEQGRLPKLSRDELVQIRNRFLDVLKEYPDVHFNGTFVNEEGIGFCDWEAPSAEVVKEIVRKVLGVPPVDKVIEIKQQVFL